MKSPFDEVRKFYREHPELFGRASQMVYVYIVCQEHNLKGRNPTLEEVYNHIFVENGGCDWCKKELKIRIERNKKFEEGRVGSY